MAAEIKYDVFISYSSEDQAWAAKLSSDLEKKGIDPFFDESAIKGGTEWEKTLISSLPSSRHMIVIWSGNAEKSSWVRREIGRFEAIIYDPTSGNAAPDRRLIFLCLENEPTAYTSLQIINSIRDAGEFQGGADNVDSNLWQLVLRKIQEALIFDDSAVPVPLIILTTTRTKLNQLNSSIKPRGGDSLDTLLQRIGIGTKNDLLPYYGQERTDWRPFGSQFNVGSILDRLKDEVNNILLPDISIRWEPIGEEFWSDEDETDKIIKEVSRLATVFSVVMLDPLALYDDAVLYRFNLLTNSLLQNEKSLILTLSPFAMPAPNSELRRLIKQMATSVYTHLYAPMQGQFARNAQCDINIGDEMDIKRALLATMGKHIRTTKQSSEFLRNRANS